MRHAITRPALAHAGLPPHRCCPPEPLHVPATLAADDVESLILQDGAEHSVLKKAFFKKSKEWHPDKVGTRSHARKVPALHPSLPATMPPACSPAGRRCSLTAHHLIGHCPCN